jgi:hypothetical protein
MQSTQLACPHCGSTLTFGMEILAGTPVECLICMQVFNAQPIAQPITTPPAAPVVAKPAAKADVPVAKPHAAPAASAVATGNAPVLPPPLPRPQKSNANASRPAPSVRRPGDSIDASKLVLLVMAVGLLFVLTGGIGFALWKITSGSPAAPPDGNDVTASSKPGATDNADVKNPENNPNPNNPGNDGVVNPPKGDGNIQVQGNDTKGKLVRKKGVKGENEFNYEDVAAINIPKAAIPGLDQQKINAAIDKGVDFLKKTQHPTGTWSQAQGHGLGHAAIGGLTLLECGVADKDMHVQRAAGFVRANLAKNSSTYELSLAILFLDRLGDPRDMILIQGMALRLLAGQNDCGGWSYHCPELTPQDMYQLFAFLHTHKQPSFQNPIPGNAKMQTPLPRDPSGLNDPFHQLSEMIHGRTIDGMPNPNPQPAKDGVNPKPKAVPPPLRVEMLKQNLQKLPVVQNQGKGKGKGQIRQGVGDNSNTQFAILALWAARRHNVPTDQGILAAYHRFAVSQNPDGGWGYMPTGRSSTHAMTCVGLLGEAMGHGASPEVVGVNPKNPKEVVIRPALEDPAIQKGLTALAKYIGTPSKNEKQTSFPMENLYFLWSVERVAMLYDLKTIGGKDWYGWGAQILVHNQQADGHWANSHYHGANASLNTSFALLFLRRSNLVQDLTHNLRLHNAIEK